MKTQAFILLGILSLASASLFLREKSLLGPGFIQTNSSHRGGSMRAIENELIDNGELVQVEAEEEADETATIELESEGITQPEEIVSDEPTFE